MMRQRVTVFVLFVFDSSGAHRDLHVLTHSFPPRRSSDLRQRRLRLAARSRLSEGGGRGRAFLSEGRKRLFRNGDGSAPRADRHAVRRNARPAEGGRFERSRKGWGLALLVGICAGDRKSTRLNSSHSCASRMPSLALKNKNN